MTDKIRYNIVSQAINQAQFASPGNNINERYQSEVDHIRNNQLLSDKEKEKAIDRITKTKDRENFSRLKGQTYQCNICGQAGFTILNCEYCVRAALESD